MYKKIFSLTLVFIMTFSVWALASEPSHWAQGELEAKYPAMFSSMLVELDYQRPVTRAEFAMMAFDLYVSLNGSMPEIEVKNPFLDLDDNMINSFAALAYALGIMEGISDTEFAPNESLTRQELCTAVIEGIYINFNPEADRENGAIDKFFDSDEVALWAVDAMNHAVSQGIIKGVGDNFLAPNSPVTVEQAMVICSRVMAEE